MFYKKATIDSYLGKKVRVTIFDGSTYEGVLDKSEFIDNYYRCLGKDERFEFQSSHIIKLKEIFL